MSKIILTAVIILSCCAGPAFAQKRSEYNFNTCSYNFYGNANPMNGQGAGGAPVNFYKGVGVTGARTEQVRANMSSNAAVYQVTPQRTHIIDNWGWNKKKATYRPQQQQVQAQQQPGYLYVPGQNNAAATTSTQCSVSFDKSGAFQYTSGGGTSYNANSNTSTNTNK